MWVRISRADKGLYNVECRPRPSTGLRPIMRYERTMPEILDIVDAEARAERAVRDAFEEVERPPRPI